MTRVLGGEHGFYHDNFGHFVSQILYFSWLYEELIFIGYYKYNILFIVW
jgi:hypothetical protein